MSKRKIQFINSEIYHVVIRATEGINLFKDERDYFRMIHDLFEFNDQAPASSNLRVDYYHNKENLTRPCLVKLTKRRKVLVDILAFCLMPNHIHLLIKQLEKNSISKFMQKFGGYVLYYNKKYKRKGHLFQDKFQAVHIKNNEQLKTIFVYIHTNPTAIIYPGWKEKGIKNVKRAIKHIENYRWSSYPDYLGNKNFPSLTNREFLLKTMKGVEGLCNFVNNWLKFKKSINSLPQILLE